MSKPLMCILIAMIFISRMKSIERPLVTVCSVFQSSIAQSPNDECPIEYMVRCRFNKVLVIMYHMAPNSLLILCKRALGGQQKDGLGSYKNVFILL